MKVRTFAVLALCGLMLVGCTAGGGGWLYGEDGGKVTFGFDAMCNGPEDDYIEFTYKDKSANVNVKGTDVLTSCSITPDGADFVGQYRAQGKQAGGSYTLHFEDTGQTGPSKGDTIVISLTGGAHGGYEHSGELQGGNIHIDLVWDDENPCDFIPCA